MYRQLSCKHPVFILLKPHLYGTANINSMANDGLVTPGGIIDKLASPNIIDLNKLVSKEVLGYLKKDMSFPAMIKRQGMTKERFKAPFPYRYKNCLLYTSDAADE